MYCEAQLLLRLPTPQLTTVQPLTLQHKLQHALQHTLQHILTPYLLLHQKLGRACVFVLHDFFLHNKATARCCL
jgi:hypothetical protein